MSIEELMKPRYLVVADYPDNPFMVNGVLNLQYSDSKKLWFYEWAEYDGIRKEPEYFFEEFPHLFRKLEWHEMREKKEMPEYLESLEISPNHHFVKVIKWYGIFFEGIKDKILQELSYTYYKPATETEYNNYINSTK